MCRARGAEGPRMGGARITILALETSASVCSVAVCRGREILAESEVQGPKVHSRALPGLIGRALAEAGVPKRAMEGVAVATGPGSYTGLRIGLATAKALAYALGIPIRGVPTLEALAVGAGSRGEPVCSLLDAGRGGVYFAVYAVEDGRPRTIIPAVRAGLEEVLQELKGWRRQIFFTGDVAEKSWSTIAAGLSGLAGRGERSLPRAAWVADAASRRWEEGETDDPLAILPCYLRPSADGHRRTPDGGG